MVEKDQSLFIEGGKTIGFRVPGCRAAEVEVDSTKEGQSLGSNCTVRFSEGTLHPVKIRERKGPSKEVIQKCEPQERNPCAPKFDDRTQEEILQLERCACRGAWDLAKNVHNLNEKDMATFFSLSSDEMETLRRSRNTTTVITANGEVQTNEEAQANVHVLELFVTVQILDDTPAVLSLDKLCEEHGYSCEWATADPEW